MRKILLCGIVFVIGVFAQTTTNVTITISVPNEIITAVNAWRIDQLEQDGVTQKFPTLKSWLESALQQEIESILVQRPTPTRVLEQAKIKSAQDIIRAQVKAITIQ